MNDGEEKRSNPGCYEQRRPSRKTRSLSGTLWYSLNFRSQLRMYIFIFVLFADKFVFLGIRVLFYVLFLLIREVFLKMGWFRKILVPSALFFHFYFVNFVFVLCLGLGIRVLFYALFMLVSG